MPLYFLSGTVEKGIGKGGYVKGGGEKTKILWRSRSHQVDDIKNVGGREKILR